MDVALAWGYVLLPLVVLGFALRWTRVLVADEPLPEPRRPRAAWSRPMNLAWCLAVIPAYVLLLVGQSVERAALVVVASLLFLALAAVDKSEQRRGLKSILGRGVAIGGAVLALALAIHLAGTATWGDALGVLVLAGVAIAGGVVARPALPGGSVMLYGLVLPVALAAAALAVTSLLRGPLGPRDLARWAERFDRDAGQLSAWDDYGRIATWLRRQGWTLESRAARQALLQGLAAAEDPLAPPFARGFDAGLLAREDLEGLRARAGVEARRAEALGEGPYPAGNVPGAAIRLLVGLDALTPEERTRVVGRLAASWPRDPSDPRRLTHAAEIAALLDLLGAGERVQEERALLQEILLAHQFREDHLWRRRVAFSDDTRSHSAHTTSGTWPALELLSAVGVPTGVDLEGLAQSLAEFGWLLLPWEDPLEWWRAMPQAARVRVQTEFLAEPTLTRRMRTFALPLALLAFAGFSVTLLVRGRSVPGRSPRP